MTLEYRGTSPSDGSADHAPSSNGGTAWAVPFYLSFREDVGAEGDPSRGDKYLTITVKFRPDVVDYPSL
jgi:hypothetical protein